MRPPESFIEQPVRSLQTMLRVIAKDDPKIPTVIPDGIYGPSTMKSVSALQYREGLPVTGVVDQRTWETIVSVYDASIIRVDKTTPIEILMEPGQVFRRGDSSPYIFLAQSMLTQLSIDHDQIERPNHTGILDDITAASLMAFQQLSALPQTGELDKITWKHLSLQFTLNAHHNALNAQ